MEPPPPRYEEGAAPLGFSLPILRYSRSFPVLDALDEFVAILGDEAFPGRGSGFLEGILLDLCLYIHAMLAKELDAAGFISLNPGTGRRCRCAAGFEEPFLLFLAQAIDDERRSQNDGGRIDVAGHGEVVLHLPELGRGDDRNRILLSIDRALLQSRIDFRPGHRGWCRTHGFKGAHMHLVFHGPDLQALKVCRRFDGTLGVGQVTESILGPGKADQVLLAHAFEHVLPDLAVQDAPRVLVVPEEERQVEDEDLGYEVAKGTA